MSSCQDLGDRKNIDIYVTYDGYIRNNNPVGAENRNDCGQSNTPLELQRFSLGDVNKLIKNIPYLLLTSNIWFIV